MSRKVVIVIGGGVGGLSAAIHAAARGFDVTLLEKNPTLGGKLNVWQAPHPHRKNDAPFVFDTGPSLLTLPAVFEDLFAFAGTDFAKAVELIRLDPIARYAWADGTVFESRAAACDREREVARLSHDDLRGWRRFAERGKNIWELSADLFLKHAPEQLLKRDGFDLSAAVQMITIPLKIGMFQKFSHLVERHVRNQKLREVLYQYATYSGASPFHAPATLAVIPHAEFNFGGWYIKGGLHQLARALETLALAKGVRIQTDCAVDQIMIENGKPRHKITGVRLQDGREMKCDAVIANSDVVHTYRNMIPPRFRRKYRDATLNQLDPGGSGMVLMLGVEGVYTQLAHHNKFMPRDYRSDLRAMFDTLELPDDPAIYVCATTRTDASVAPAGCENLFVLASAPALHGKVDWNTSAATYRDKIVHTLETRFGLSDLSKRIVVEHQLTPVDFQRIYNANAGSIYGIGSNSRKTAFLRPPNRDREVGGLYFAGGATHPGGGLPLVALSGKIAAELLNEDFQN